MTSQNRVAMFTPLPPAATGTADYAAALISELEKVVSLEVFTRTPRSFDPKAFDAVIYQIGNNPFHAGIYETALRHPGIVVLHEPNLHDLIRAMTAGSPEAYLREICYEIFGQEWDAIRYSGAGFAGQQPRNFSILRRLLDASRACIVHSTWAAGVVRMKGFRGRIEKIPHGIRTQPADGTKWRARLGLDEGQPLIGVFGFLRPDKRIAECLRAFRILADQMPEVRLLIAGTPHPEVPVERLAEDLGINDKVFLLDHLSREDLDGYIAACDAVLNLRWPTFGETSGIAARAFGLGRTVIMSDSGASREYPDGACVRIPCDEFLERVLADTLVWLLRTPGLTAEIGAAAAKWAAENCSWPAVARHYAAFAGRYAEPADSRPSAADMPVPRLREYLRKWVEPGTSRARYLADHEDRLARTIQLIPPGTAEDRILELGCYLQITPALRDLLGYGEVRGSYLGHGGTDLKAVTAHTGETITCAIDLFDCEGDTFPYPNGHFATVLCCELLEHLQRDPMQMMSEIYRILCPAGILVLTTPNVVSLRAISAVLNGAHPGFYNRYPDPRVADETKHEREYTPAEIGMLLEAAGFTVEHIETGPYGGAQPAGAEFATRALSSLGLSQALRGECIFAVGRKESLPRDSRPSWLYDAALSAGVHA